MKLSANHKDLQQATSNLQGAIADRAMSQIGLRATEGTLELSSNDRIMALYSKVSCNLIDPGTIFVPAKIFADVVKELPTGEVFLESTEAWLQITAGPQKTFSMKIPLIKEADWKPAPEMDENLSCRLPSQKLSYLIQQVQFCIATESPRNYGAVGYLHKSEDGRLRLVGTDGYRLSYCDLEADLPEKFVENGICISKRGLSELSRMSHAGFEEISLAVAPDGTTLLAEVPNHKIFLRLSAVKYPNYQGVLPKEVGCEVDVSRGEMLSVSRRVLLAADKTRALQLRFSKSSLTISSRPLEALKAAKISFWTIFKERTATFL